jgi:hypothetical protein
VFSGVFPSKQRANSEYTGCGVKATNKLGGQKRKWPDRFVVQKNNAKNNVCRDFCPEKEFR